MPAVREPVRVAINVMRARITLLGFNIAIITFQINEVRLLAGSIELPGLGRPVHLVAAQALFLGLALSFVAMISYIASSAFDEAGTCTHWSLLAGDLLMYLALAQTMSGFFGPFLLGLHDVALLEAAQQGALDVVRVAVLVAGGVAWATAAYVGPLVSLLRSPFGRRTTIALGAAYASMLVTTSVVETASLQLRAALLGDDPLRFSWLGGLAAPLRW